MLRNPVVLFSKSEGLAMIESACKAKGLSFSEFRELVEAEAEEMSKRQGKQNRNDLWDVFDDILDRIPIQEE